MTVQKNCNPLVSIIIPTYNRPEYLKRAILSCLNQTYNNIEIIVVDDNSTVNHTKTIESFNDKRIKYYKNSVNKGAPYSRNKGFGLSCGEYLTFLDDDDELLSEKIRLQVEKFRSSKVNNLGVVTCDVEYKRTDLNDVKKNRKQGHIYLDLLKRYCVYGTETLLIKREFFEKINGFDERLESNQEYDLCINLSKYCNFDYVSEVLSYKYESIDQISYNFTKKISGTKYLYKKHLNHFKTNNVYIYNMVRFEYLLVKYHIGKFLGMRFYKCLP
ncbi:glycosyltransferase family A protein [Methanococcus maripaludis]|uniref:Glycosyltransferase involved in cell wall biosynthesis n=1 Tax=Methanococcus maripaludis TaxID=39152 RepID=A0A7J9PAU8_METMI|nr:glycosyltransferase family A protein [Methanococcus maripaludis]MBA2859850.1 glycosyltransferase involved in cell wall biosynthesis [Methanococcus maripaludis]